MQRENRTESAENYHTVEWSQQEASQEGSTKEAQDISSASKIKHSTAMGLKTTVLQGGKGQDLRTQKTAVSPRPGPRPLLALAGMYLALGYFIYQDPGESLRATLALNTESCGHRHSTTAWGRAQKAPWDLMLFLRDLRK